MNINLVPTQLLAIALIDFVTLGTRSSFDEESLHPAQVPIDRTDRTDVHDLRDQLKSMGASKLITVWLHSCSPWKI